MDWQEILALIFVGACVWLLGRKLMGKSKKDGACEHCVPGKNEKPRS
jgi:hypothetical protein